jgi:hypothetical protein
MTTRQIDPELAAFLGETPGEGATPVNRVAPLVTPVAKPKPQPKPDPLACLDGIISYQFDS